MYLILVSLAALFESLRVIALTTTLDEPDRGLDIDQTQTYTLI